MEGLAHKQVLNGWGWNKLFLASTLRSRAILLLVSITEVQEAVAQNLKMTYQQLGNYETIDQMKQTNIWVL